MRTNTSLYALVCASYVPYFLPRLWFCLPHIGHFQYSSSGAFPTTSGLAIYDNANTRHYNEPAAMEQNILHGKCFIYRARSVRAALWREAHPCHTWHHLMRNVRDMPPVAIHAHLCRRPELVYFIGRWRTDSRLEEIFPNLEDAGIWLQCQPG